MIISIRKNPHYSVTMRITQPRYLSFDFNFAKMAAPSLFGPPELHIPKPKNQNIKPDSPPSVPNPFMDAMASNFNNPPPPSPPMGYTENMSPTYLATGNPCLDFFFHIVPDTPAESIKQRLNSAWDHNPLTTLKLIFNLRGVKGTGKTDKEGFYTAALWLHQFHPKTLACNVASLAEFGYIKDMPEILYRLLEGADVRKIQKAEWEQQKMRRSKFNSSAPRRRYAYGSNSYLPAHRRRYAYGSNFYSSAHRLRYAYGSNFYSSAHQRYDHDGFNFSSSAHRRYNYEQMEWVNPPEIGRRRSKPVVSEEVKAERAKAEKERISMAKEEKRLAMAKKVIERYSRDPDYRFLFERISDFFAESLKSDLQLLNSDKQNDITMAAKWCPSLYSSFDRATLLCESIARKVFPKDSDPEYLEIEDSHYAYRVRDRLRKEVLVPLRKVLELPEVYIGFNKWDSIPYNRVASVAMKFYREKFIKHDSERFYKHLEDVRAGKAKIAAGALLPHEIIQSLEDGDGRVAELQWKRMVDDLLKKGKLKNCMAVCDVSGSMYGKPLEVCVALGLLVSELSDDPWKGKLITFSQRPQLQSIKGDSLWEKTKFVARMDWGMNTDFQKVFDAILKVAIDGNLKEEEMIKRLFVFSDMEFDQASAQPWETDYKVIVQKFTEEGYGNAIPEIVFWNLRDSKATPVPATQKGVALVSGFSKNLIKIFIQENGVISPEAIMEKAISGKSYQKLAVVD